MPERKGIPMAATDTTQVKQVEQKEPPEQQIPKVAESNGGKSDTLALAYKDATDILSILDNFGAEQPTAKKLPKDASLTAEEQDRLAQLLGEDGSNVKAESKEQPPLADEQPLATPEDQKIEDIEKVSEITPKETEDNDKESGDLPSESTAESESGGIYNRVRSILDAIPSKRAKQSEPPATAEPQVKPPDEQPVQTEQLQQAPAISDKQEQTQDADLPVDTKSQIEAVAVEREEIGKKLDVAAAGIQELEENQFDDKSDKADRTEEVGRLRSELIKISKWHESLETQVKKLLKIAENSNTDREALESNLTQAHEVICTLEKKVQPMQEKIQEYEDVVNDLHNQLVDQSAMLTSTHEKLQHEVTQRRKIEQMLRDIKSRLRPLTRTKSSTQPKQTAKKSNRRTQG
jgi:predicted  nucleic acid-binding Zn-ribbon protein